MADPNKRLDLLTKLGLGKSHKTRRSGTKMRTMGERKMDKYFNSRRDNVD